MLRPVYPHPQQLELQLYAVASTWVLRPYVFAHIRARDDVYVTQVV